MAELTFKSPGVSVREIDLSGPTQLSPSGIPAGVIGTAVRGPAFVPITVATYADFVSKFGATDGEKFGPLAMHEWLQNARAGTYVRVLGVGDGKARLAAGNTNSGKVTRAGFVVGDQLVQGNGALGNNSKAFHGTGPTNVGTALGRTYFLGAFMSQSEGSTVFTDAGMTPATVSLAHPILRGVLMAPSGVILSLSCSMVETNTVNTSGSIQGAFGSGSAGNDAGALLGDVILENSQQAFTMLLNGHKVSSTSNTSINASFDPQAANYFSKVFNRDPAKIEEQGHFLYTHYDINQSYAVVTGTNLVTAKGSRNFAAGRFSTELDGTKADVIAFLLTGSHTRNVGTARSPNYENFENRYATAFSPFIVSQKFGGKNVNLFRFHALDDGEVGSAAYKVSVENIVKSSDPKNEYGTFNILVRKFDDTDQNKVVLEKYSGLTLDPSSDRYIARIIGDTYTYYDFDKADDAQKLVVEGLYPNRSQFLRVEMSAEVLNNSVSDEALPTGFRGLHHLVTSGSNHATNTGALLTGSLPGLANGDLGITNDILARVTQLPLPMRQHVMKGVTPKNTANAKLYWGAQFELKEELAKPNKSTKKIDPSWASFVKYFPDFHLDHQNPWVGANEGVSDVGGTVLDADRFNNNLFSLEKVQVLTGSDNRPDSNQWVAARYQRHGSQASSLLDNNNNADSSTRFINPSLDYDHLQSRKYLKFTVPLQGGFDGVNIFNKDKAEFRDAAVRREMDNSNQGVSEGPTVQAYRRAIQVMEEKSDVDIQLLAIPGQRHEAITDFAIQSVERRFDAMLIMDVEEKDEISSLITGSKDTLVNVTNTISNFSSRALDSSFAAAYFPDVVVSDPSTAQNVQVPPSVAVLGAFALNDRLAHPWFAPAGFSRGSLDRVLEAKVRLNRTNLDELYDADINPIIAFPHTDGTIIFGQKTLMAAASALDRVNVRRLLIDVRRKVKTVANTLLFEPNRASTLAAFAAAVTPLLNTIQQQQGLDRFKVQIDTTTTTQTDVENNTIRGKIFLQPTRAVEFISLDFVVTNAGADAV